jgi:hypothetical protein
MECYKCMIQASAKISLEKHGYKFTEYYCSEHYMDFCEELDRQKKIEANNKVN